MDTTDNRVKAMPTSPQTDDKKVAKLIAKIMRLINKKKLSVAEMIVLYGNLGYHMGASMAGFKGTGPTLEVLKHEYYQNPTVDTGLMIQGLMITDWEKDFHENPKLSRLADKNKE